MIKKLTHQNSSNSCAYSLSPMGQNLIIVHKQVRTDGLGLQLEAMKPFRQIKVSRCFLWEELGNLTKILLVLTNY